MAARKKAKSKAGRRKAPAKKPVARKKLAPARKKAAAKKTAAKRTPPRKKPVARPAAPKKQPAARPAPAPKARAVSPAPQPAQPAAAPAAAPVPAAGEERVGTVTHYYSHLSVAVVRLDSGNLRVGDTIRISGHTSDFRQKVDSLQIEHEAVPEVSAGQEFGLKVNEHAREHDVVYKVTAP